MAERDIKLPLTSPDLTAELDKQDAAYSNPDKDERGCWKSVDATRAEHRDYAYYPIITPSGKEVWPAKGRSWIFTKEELPQLMKDRRLWFGANGDSKPSKKLFLTDVKQGIVPTTWWPYEECGHNDESKKELKRLFVEDVPFQTPKPSRLIKRMMQLTTNIDSHDIVLDFFAGSGTTAQAVLELNQEDDGNRKFILVQLPEKTDNLKFHTIADITRERVRRVIDKLKNEGKIPPGPPLSRGGNKSKSENKSESLFAQPEDSASLPPLAKGVGGGLGFRAFKLSSSNFKIWDADVAPTNPTALAEQLKLYADNVEGSRDPQDILFELILKTGLPLSSRIATIDVADGKAYSVADGNLLVCLENPSLARGCAP